MPSAESGTFSGNQAGAALSFTSHASGSGSGRYSGSGNDMSSDTWTSSDPLDSGHFDDNAAETVGYTPAHGTTAASWSPVSFTITANDGASLTTTRTAHFNGSDPYAADATDTWTNSLVEGRTGTDSSGDPTGIATTATQSGSYVFTPAASYETPWTWSDYVDSGSHDDGRENDFTYGPLTGTATPTFSEPAFVPSALTAAENFGNAAMAYSQNGAGVHLAPVLTLPQAATVWGWTTYTPPVGDSFPIFAINAAGGLASVNIGASGTIADLNLTDHMPHDQPTGAPAADGPAAKPGVPNPNAPGAPAAPNEAAVREKIPITPREGLQLDLLGGEGAKYQQLHAAVLMVYNAMRRAVRPSPEPVNPLV